MTERFPEFKVGDRIYSATNPHDPEMGTFIVLESAVDKMFAVSEAVYGENRGFIGQKARVIREYGNNCVGAPGIGGRGEVPSGTIRSTAWITDEDNRFQQVEQMLSGGKK